MIERGDVVTADNQTYEIVCESADGSWVCRNLNPTCLAQDELRNFKFCDFDIITKRTHPKLYQGGGI